MLIRPFQKQDGMELNCPHLWSHNHVESLASTDLTTVVQNIGNRYVTFCKTKLS